MPSEPHVAAPAGRNGFRVFATVWAGQSISTLGSALTNFGIGIWLFQQTHSATAFALSAIASSLPGILLSPIAGALVDRWDRRVAMIVSDSGAGLASLLLVLLVISNHLSLPAVYALMALSSSFATLSWPAMTAATSLLVPKEQLGRTNGMLQFSDAAAMIVAPALGGALMKLTGLQGLIIADVASFLVGIGTLLVVRIPRPVKTVHHAGKPSIFREALFGWQYIAARPGLVGMVMFFLLINFAMGMTNVLIAPLVLTFFDAGTMGMIGSVGGFGMLAGSIAMSIWGGPKRRVLGLVSFGLMGALCLMLLGMPPNPFLMAGLLFTFIFGAPIANGCSQAIWQAKVAADVQGRVFATRRMIAWMMTPLAFGIAGPLADKVFTPGMHPGGSLATVLGPFYGTGPGAGLRVMFTGIGILSFVVIAIAWANPHFRHVETEMPDAEHKAEGDTPTALVRVDDTLGETAEPGDGALHVG